MARAPHRPVCEFGQGAGSSRREKPATPPRGRRVAGRFVLEKFDRGGDHQSFLVPKTGWELITPSPGGSEIAKQVLLMDSRLGLVGWCIKLERNFSKPEFKEYASKTGVLELDFPPERAARKHGTKPAAGDKASDQGFRRLSCWTAPEKTRALATCGRTHSFHRAAGKAAEG